MAKNPFWLRGARGKIAGAVAQKSEVGTILREKVTPANPRTNGQMSQRIVFGTVTQAAKAMLPIIGISFEGITKEKLNRRKFVQLNSTRFGQLAKFENGAQAQKLAFSTKGNNQLIPNPYIVSRGSLDIDDFLVPKFTYDSNNPTRVYLETSVIKTITLKAGEHYSAFDIWEMFYGIGRNCQVTIPYIETMNGSAGKFMDAPAYESGMQAIDYIRYSRFLAPRCVLLNELPAMASSYGYDIPTTQVAIDEYIENMSDVGTVMDACVDKTKSDPILYNMLMTIGDVHAAPNAGGIEVELELDWSALNGEYPGSEWRCAAIGTIVSKPDGNGGWLYSNCDLVTGFLPQKPLSDYYYGLAKNNAILAYLSTSQREKNYLQTGGDGGNI